MLMLSFTRVQRDHLVSILCALIVPRRPFWIEILSWMTSDFSIWRYPREVLLPFPAPTEYPCKIVFCSLYDLTIFYVRFPDYWFPCWLCCAQLSQPFCFPYSQRTFLNFHLYLPSKPSLQVPEFRCVLMLSGSVQTMLNNIELFTRIVDFQARLLKPP